MSGTPLNELGTAIQDPVCYVFLVPRGEAGRTSDVWDLGLRVTYDLASLWTNSVQTRLIADFLHVASQREAVDFVQLKYLSRDGDGNHTTPNPYYGQPVAFQPPAAVRLGLEMDF
jgi:hypothetical protein